MNMSKKRKTRREKEKAKTRRSLFQAQNFSFVKREFIPPNSSIEQKKEYEENPEFSGFFGDWKLILRDIVKTLILASLILASELVIYFIWR